MKARHESFGGIISLEKPPLLVYVDKNYMLNLGYGESGLWRTPSLFLSAPTEVHFSITNKCPMQCKNCYVNAGEKLANELTTAKLKEVIDLLTEMKVFHIAFGGGEPFAREDFLEVAEYARGKGIVPNVTTNGFYIDERIAKKCDVFGQINVSLDGIGDNYKELRGVNCFEIADNAIKILRKYNKNVGINCVVFRDNFDTLEQIVRYAKNNKLRNILFLRYKPSGRAEAEYYDNKLTYKQNKMIYHVFMNMFKKYRIRIYADCSFFPMICYHNPPKKMLKFFSIFGCEAGNILAGILPDGRFNACSFASDTEKNIFDLRQEWEYSPHLNRYRNWIGNAKEPCKSCGYLQLCKGGCHIVAEFAQNDFHLPDPDCPRVIEYYNNRFFSNLVQ